MPDSDYLASKAISGEAEAVSPENFVTPQNAARSGGSRPRVAHRARHQVGHQRDLELVEVQGRGAARRRLPGELGDILARGLALDDPLDGGEAPRHRADAAA